jgi:hypothetical protein
VAIAGAARGGKLRSARSVIGSFARVAAHAESPGGYMKARSSLAIAAAALLPLSAAAAPQTATQSTSKPKDLPYVAVHNPQFIAAQDATFLQPEDRTIGVIEEKVAKAYPAGILAQHGLVEDEAPGGPVAVTW